MNKSDIELIKKACKQATDAKKEVNNLNKRIEKLEKHKCNPVNKTDKRKADWDEWTAGLSEEYGEIVFKKQIPDEKRNLIRKSLIGAIRVMMEELEVEEIKIYLKNNG